MDLINWFDYNIALFISELTRHYHLFDRTVVLISKLDIFKGAVFITLLWWLWFRPCEDQIRTRKIIIATIVGAILALIFARTLAAVLPVRQRPMHMHPSVLYILLPTGMGRNALRGWSSFPSDHTALFFALALGIFLVSRKVGLSAFLYALIAIALPRLYGGLHYASDLIVGGVIGAGSVWLLTRSRFLDRVSDYPLRILVNKPGFFYAGLFFVSYQITTLFNDVRTVADFVNEWVW